MPSGKDTRLYNYGVPMIGRSKLRFPAPREQEYAARARRAALREIWGFARDARSVVSSIFNLFQSVSVRCRRVPRALVSEPRATASRTHHRKLARIFRSRRLNRRDLSSRHNAYRKGFRSASSSRSSSTFFFGACRLLNEYVANVDRRRILDVSVFY